MNWYTQVGEGFPCGSAGKESFCNVGDLGLIPEMGQSPGEGKGYPLQYSGLENSPGGLYSPWGHKELDTTEWLALLSIRMNQNSLCYWKKPGKKRVYRVWFHFYTILKNTNWSIVTESISVVTTKGLKKWGGEEMRKKITEGALKKYVRSDGYVYYLGYGNGFAGVYIWQNL